jgi:L-asparaginase
MVMKKILLLTTGGTIASVESGNGLKPDLTGEELIQCIPEAAEICELKSEPVILRGSSKGVDSSNIQPEDWVEIAKSVFDALRIRNFDGVVITHGTDTMAYTSSMLSFMLTNLNKPVILTGAQRPMSDPFTDAKKNLLDAVRVAVEGYPGIYIVFGGRIIKGTKASKVHTTADKAFDSINAPLAGKINGKDVVMNYPLPPGTGGVNIDINISKDVFLLKLTPGIDPGVINKIVSMGYRGIVIEGFGLGGVPNEGRSLLEPIRNAIKEKEVSVVVMTQCRNGITDFKSYEVGIKAQDTGIIPVSSMTVEAAVTKLMRVLEHTSKPEEVKEMMQKNICGELS